MGSKDFIEYLKPYAQAMESKYGIDWRIIVAQAALESGWGEYGRQYNLWGMRYEGPAGKDSAGYALFNDQWEAIEAYIYNIRKNHPTAWTVRNNPTLFFNEIQNPNPPNAGAWAEDPKYTNKLNSVFIQNLSTEITAINPNLPPVESPDTASVYFPKTDTEVKKYKADEEGERISEQRYYIKLQHVDDNKEPTRALTIKIAPDSQLKMVREKLIKPKEDNKLAEVEEACSVELLEEGVLLDFHNNNNLENNAQKLTDQVQLRDDYIGIYRSKEGKKTKTETIILADEVIQLEVANDDKKSRIEIQPNKILAKDGDASFIRIEKDIVQGKNKSGSEVYMNDGMLVAHNKQGTRAYIRGDFLQLKNSGCSVTLSGDLLQLKNSGCLITLSGGVLTISAQTVIINGSALVDINGSRIDLN